METIGHSTFGAFTAHSSPTHQFAPALFKYIEIGAPRRAVPLLRLEVLFSPVIIQLALGRCFCLSKRLSLCIPRPSHFVEIDRAVIVGVYVG